MDNITNGRVPTDINNTIVEENGVKYKIQKTNNTQLRIAIETALKRNGGYCPCKLDKCAENKCPCCEFMCHSGECTCHCGLYCKMKCC